MISVFSKLRSYLILKLSCLSFFHLDAHFESIHEGLTFFLISFIVLKTGVSQQTYRLALAAWFCTTFFWLDFVHLIKYNY